MTRVKSTQTIVGQWPYACGANSNPSALAHDGLASGNVDAIGPHCHRISAFVATTPTSSPWRPRFESFAMANGDEVTVDVTTGNLSLVATDGTITGTGLDLVFQRRYNSRTSWRYDDRPVNWAYWPARTWIHPRSHGTVSIALDDWLVFHPDGEGGFVSPRGLDADLVELDDGGVELRHHASGTTWRFASLQYGWLQSRPPIRS